MSPLGRQEDSLKSVRVNEHLRDTKQTQRSTRHSLQYREVHVKILLFGVLHSIYFLIDFFRYLTFFHLPFNPRLVRLFVCLRLQTLLSTKVIIYSVTLFLYILMRSCINRKLFTIYHSSGTYLNIRYK